MTRRLVLKKETLVELATDDLRSVAGGAITQACPTRYCASTNINCMLSQYINPCVTDLC